MKLLKDLTKKELEGKKVLVRVDFNVPVEGNHIKEAFRIRAAVPTINYLIRNGAQVILASHITDTNTFSPILDEIIEILGQKVILLDGIGEEALTRGWELSQLLMYDNLRRWPGEEANDSEFAKQLAQGIDLYVNDAFAVAHRQHASVVAITKQLPSCAGFLIKSETEHLTKAVTASAKGKVLLLGGAKIGTKLPVIKNFLDKAEWILVGGALVNNFYKYHGLEVGKSKVDDEALDVLKDLPRKNIFIAEDLVVSEDATGNAYIHIVGEKGVSGDEMILDIGPATSKHYAEIIAQAQMVIWNGPMGMFEVSEFAGATSIVAHAVAKAAFSIVGGGDTIEAINQLGLQDTFTYVSTGGGAMLDFLGGIRLPALEALGYYGEIKN